MVNAHKKHKLINVVVSQIEYENLYIFYLAVTKEAYMNCES